ncbi:bacteriocin immunity protein [Streptococcus sp.]|uniref:bacteriocin immunity protein n=1 Tax=Streptococcus sp. TaxID=1306 RepID=UPI0025FD9FFB|nr:bacteriocin immunity protein [Streptococcus sp.]MBS5351281.1 bacteriocin immunity protein [Streptococcus sp.]
MTKSNNTQITDILNNIYNLIVNPETTEKERKLLVTFKNEIEVGKKDNSELLAELRRAIQDLAVRNLSKGISLSSGVSDLSKTLTEFQDESERNINIARGLSSSLGMLSFR